MEKRSRIPVAVSQSKARPRRILQTQSTQTSPPQPKVVIEQLSSISPSTSSKSRSRSRSESLGRPALNRTYVVSIDDVNDAESRRAKFSKSTSQPTAKHVKFNESLSNKRTRSKSGATSEDDNGYESTVTPQTSKGRRSRRGEIPKAFLARVITDIDRKYRTPQPQRQKEKNLRKKQKRENQFLVQSSDAYESMPGENKPNYIETERINLSQYLDPAFRFQGNEISSNKVTPTKPILVDDSDNEERQPIQLERVSLSQYLRPELRANYRRAEGDQPEIETERISLSQYLRPELRAYYRRTDDDQPNVETERIFLEQYLDRNHSTPNRWNLVPRIILTEPSIDYTNDTVEQDQDQTNAYPRVESQSSISTDNSDLNSELYMETHGLDMGSDSENTNEDESISDESSEQGYYYDIPKLLAERARSRLEKSTDGEETVTYQVRQMPRREFLNSSSSAEEFFTPSTSLNDPDRTDRNLTGEYHDIYGRVDFAPTRILRMEREPPKQFDKVKVLNMYNRGTSPKKQELRRSRRLKEKRLKKLRNSRLELLQSIEIDQEKARHREKMLHLRLKYLKMNILIRNLKKNKKNSSSN